MGEQILIADLFIKEGKKHLGLIEKPTDINVVFDEAYQLRKKHKCDIWVRVIQLSEGMPIIKNETFRYQPHNELDL
ncbi:hypothetical protein [Bacillus atrophaeus]|nr:hypothetical protein [Bacillus atrophaeus]MED1032533.1 hypothetical protein [Bacillus atrophaeus]